MVAVAPPKTLNICDVPEDIIIATERGMICENLLSMGQDRGEEESVKIPAVENEDGRLHVRWKGVDV
jgi:hypothetical protein